MAGNIQISVKDEASARAWLEKVVLLNEEYHDAMKESGETLEDMQNFADGTMVDEFVDLGSSILTAADATFDAINKIADTVNTVISKTGEFVADALGVISKVRGLFGV